MRQLWAICVKDIRLLLRDRAGFFFTFFFPLIVAIFFGTIFAGGSESGGNKLEVVVLDLDRSAGSRAFVETLTNGGDLETSIQPALRRDPAKPGTPIALSPDSTDAFDEALSRDAGIAQVRRGDASACIVVPKGFGAARAAPFAGQTMKLEVAADPARMAAQGMLEGILTKYGFQQFSQGFSDPAMMRQQAKASLDILKLNPTLSAERRKEFEKFFGNLDNMLGSIPGDDDPKPETSAKSSSESSSGASAPRAQAAAFSPITITSIPITRERAGPKNPYEITFPQGILWGVMGCALGFSMSLVLERTRGTLVRLRSAPIGAWQILGGKGLACFLVTCAVSIMLMAIGMLVFKIRPLSIPKVGVAIACTGLCFVGVMMLLATFAKTERGSSGLGWGVLMLLSMIGGGMIPLEFLPAWLKPISQISPIKWAVQAIEGGIWRGFSWGEMALPLCILAGIGIVGFIVGMRVMGDAERA